MKSFRLTLASPVLCVLSMAFCLCDSLYAQKDNFKWIRNVEQQNVRDYNDGMSAYYENGKWGFTNTEGEVAIQPDFDEVEDFSDDLAIVKKDGKWGVVNKTGKYVHDCEYDSISAFDSGIAYAMKGAIPFYLYESGKKVQLTRSSYRYMPFSNGMARIQNIKTGRWGYTDAKGEVVISPDYSVASDFNNGHAVVERKGKSYIINKKGDIKPAPFRFDEKVTFFDNGTGYIIGEDDKLKFFDRGLNVTSGEFLQIDEFVDGVARAKDSEGNILLINEKGDKVLDLKSYDDAGNLSEGLAWVRKNGKYGYVDLSGNLVIDTLFTYASDFKSECAYVAKGLRQGVIKMSRKNETYPVIKISDIQIADNSKNGMVEAEESFDVTFKVSNVGNESLKDAVVSLGVDPSQSDWFNFGTTKVNADMLKPGEEKMMKISLASNTDIITETIRMNLKGEASNMYSMSTFDFEFPASGISACRPLLETFWVYTSDHSPLAPGKEAYLMVSVVNEGTDMAKDVTVNLNWPDGVKYADKTLTIPRLSPNEKCELITTFTIPETESPSKEFSMVANVGEFTHKRNDVRYLSFSTGKRNVLTNLLLGSIAGGAEAPAAVPLVAPRMAESELLLDLNQRVSPNRNRFALVIGNEDYNSMKPNSAYQPDVEFAERDAETFAKFATKVMGVSEENVILVKNATFAQMHNSLEKIKKLAAVSPEKLELIIYYAGHGQVDGDTKESYLIPVDVSLTSPKSGMRLEDFYAQISSCNAEKTMVFLDACYSGVGRGIIIKPKSTPISGNMVIMTATSSTQRSMPYHDKSHGLFTYYLLKTLKDSQPGISISDLFNEVSASVRMKSVLINNSEQTPELLNGTGISQGWEQWTF